jgi:hypothetical protein
MEIPPKVMSKWLHNVIPVVMFAMQAPAFSIGIVVQKFKPILPAWLSAPFVGFIFSEIVLLTLATVFWASFLEQRRTSHESASEPTPSPSFVADDRQSFSF